MMTLGTVVENTTREEGFMKRALLVIALAIARLHGAVITVESRPGEVSRFRIEFGPHGGGRG
jgi:light-regulated signal transduction histidine kinase (bacteriophytochrome)